MAKIILSIDGGGIRGKIPAIVLQYFEERTKKRISEMFDLIAGTSTGGILALLLSIKEGSYIKYAAKDCVELYDKHGKDIFSRSRWLNAIFDGEWYQSKPFEAVLNKYLGHKTLKDVDNNLMISSYDIEERKLIIFKSWDKKYNDIECSKIARATSAAPTFFEPIKMEVEKGNERVLIDGGTVINNPAMSAYSEAKRLWPDEPIVVVSLGTGENTRPIYYEECKDWNIVKWLKPLLSIWFSGMNDAVDYQLRHILPEHNYYRLQTKLTMANDDMDDVSQNNLLSLQQEAYKLIYDNQDRIGEIIKLLNSFNKERNKTEEK